jgi:phospholipid/cholesterol/gamma-HCH transport system permease protein
VTSIPQLSATGDGGALALRAAGSWTVAHAAQLERLVGDMLPLLRERRAVTIDISGVRELDTVGAWMVEKIVRLAPAADVPNPIGIPERFASLIAEIHGLHRSSPVPPPARNPAVGKLDDIGRAVVGSKDDLAAFLHMLGALVAALARAVRHPRSFRFTSAVYQLYRVGWQAIPIMILISFLIGAIIAQQGIFHFRKFGADAYVVDMVGILVLREIGVLIVAIMVAGRSGSAYTAEIGSMKMREEIDALSTMGLDPVEVLILPRILALVVALPILAFLGSLAALYGGGLIAWLYGGMSPAIYIARLHEAVSVAHLEVGLLKAPFMALVIGVVAAAEGLRVKGSAESLGRQTTTSVVKSIFLVIVLDGLFAVFFASIGM